VGLAKAAAAATKTPPKSRAMRIGSSLFVSRFEKWENVYLAKYNRLPAKSQAAP
jgi:hypothetical protein